MTTTPEMRFPNWREVLRQNTQKTYLTIAIFIALYLVIGLVIDTCIHAYFYVESPAGNLIALNPGQVLELLLAFLHQSAK